MTGEDVLTRARERDLSDVVAGRHIIVCTGSGGVGKTTTAATLAVAAARQGRRTIVVTIDPARRLAQSMGLDRLDDTPQAVVGVDNLDAMMLDMKRTFDEVIDRHAADPARAERIKSNTFYQQVSSTLAGTQEYMAMEKLFDLHTTGRYDCIVVDTPPTRNALDFLDAPRRLTDFMDGRFLKMFLSPGLSAGRTVGKVAAFGTGLFMKAASRITGSTVLDDLAEFFQSMDGMYEGFKTRSQQVYHLLASGETAFVVVSSPEPGALREARFFTQRLAKDGMPLAGLVINRITPEVEPGLAEAVAEVAEEDRERLAAGSDEERAVAGLLTLVEAQAAVHDRERGNIASGLFGLDPRALLEVPQMATDVHDIEGLDQIAAHLVTTDAA